LKPEEIFMLNIFDKLRIVEDKPNNKINYYIDTKLMFQYCCYTNIINALFVDYNSIWLILTTKYGYEFPDDLQDFIKTISKKYLNIDITNVYPLNFQ